MRAVRGVIVFATLAAGCSIAPQKAPPSTLELPAAWHGQVGPAAPLEHEWWHAFGDPALDTLVQQALVRNGDVRVARSRLQEYQARVRIAASGEQPAINVAFSPARARVLGPFGTPLELTSYQGNVQASYELDVFGKLASITAAARADYASQQAAADAVALSVAASAASGYLNLRGLDAQLELAQATLESRRRSLDLARRQFEIGYSSRLDWSQALAEYYATAAIVPLLQRAISQQENALDILAGANPGPVARGTALGALGSPAIAAPGLPSELLRRRPDIVQAERAIVAADATLAAARDQLLPSFRLTASGGVQASSIARLLNSPIALWSVGGSVLAPLFDAGRLRAQADIAASQRDRAVFAYESVVRNAFAETENALAGVQRLREQLEQAEQRSRAAAEVLRIAHDRYASGYASYLEELDAQRTAFSADVNVLQLRASLLAAHVDLYRALGGGWSVAGR
jgi:outer membrane protein, multidrug efflux system